MGGARHKDKPLRIPGQLAARLAEQVHGRIEATRHRNQIAVDPPDRTIESGAVGGHLGDLRPLHPTASQAADQRMSGMDLDPARPCGVDQSAVRLRAQINDAGDPRAPVVQGDRGSVAVIIRGHDQRPPPGQNAVAHGVTAHRTGQHHAGPVVVAEHQGPLDRAGRQHHPLGPHLPDPLARDVRHHGTDVIGHPLGDGQVVVVVISVHGRPGQQRDLRHRPKLRHHLRHPCRGRKTVDLHVVLGQQGAAELGAFIGQDHPRTGPCGRECRRKTGRTTACDQHVVMGVHPLIPIRIRTFRRLAETGGMPDHMLIAHPERGRPHEGLVVEPRRKQLVKQLVHRPHIELETGPAVLALSDQAVE